MPINRNIIKRIRFLRRSFYFIRSEVYLEYLKWEIDTESAFLELPLTILVLVSFAVLAMNILHQEQLYTIETAIEKDIIENANFAWSGNFGHKGIEQVPVFKSGIQRR